MRRLARAWGIQTSYVDVDRRRRHANPDVLLAVLRELGAPVVEHADVPDALREHEDAGTGPHLEPVHVAWDGALPPLRGRLPHVAVRCRLELETGAVHEWSGALHERANGNEKADWRTGLPRTVPFGYHRLELCAGSAAFETSIISAPRRAYDLPEARAWGLFLPLYAFRSARGDGSDYAALGALARWTHERGGSLFGTLPLLATFLAEPFEPSPYAPASRLFWNDFYIDVDRLPGAHPDPRLDAARRELAQCADADVVDYRRIAALKRRIIDDAAQRFFGGPCDSRREPDAITRDYARFRAVCDRRRQGWHDWPDRLRSGDIRDGDFGPRDEQYHLYAAWVAERQLAEISGRPPRRAAALYLDLPLGVHRDGFDSWRWPRLFASGASAGAPPDTFFPGGQDWGFAPVEPRALRADGYRYFRDCLRHHARFAGALRLDHVMSLERLFWIPRGFAPDQGVYVRYPLDEMMAVLTLESVRHRTAIVGEDLGTVSRSLRTAMGRHGLYRMFVLQFEATPGDESPPRGIPRFAVASLNTHDMPPFAAWRRGGRDDVDPAQGEASAGAHARVAAERGVTETKTALGRALDGLAASRARCVILNLEDLWLETRPQNMPGSPSEQNWRHRARLTFDEIRGDPDIGRQVERIADKRQPDPAES